MPHDRLGVHPLAGVPDEQARDEVPRLRGDAAPTVLLGKHHIAGTDGQEEAALATERQIGISGGCQLVTKSIGTRDKRRLWRMQG